MSQYTKDKGAFTY